MVTEYGTGKHAMNREYRIVGPNSVQHPFKGSLEDALAKLAGFDRYNHLGHVHRLQFRDIPSWKDVGD